MDPKPWFRLKENELLERRISEFDLQIQGSGIQTLIERLYAELDQRGLTFHPACFPADEWFCPVGIPAIGIPFYLIHSRLRRLEQKFMLELEGGTKTDFMKLIRHEAGHAFSYAYQLQKKTRWRQLFGSPSKDYPDDPTTYRPKPYSRSYVVHLDNWYAQSHPDEDFAETFAVWLTPNLKWKRKFKNWRAIKKLEYVDQLMTKIAGKPPLVNPKFNPKQHNGLQIKLKTYFDRKKKIYAESYPDFYDADLKLLFTDHPDERSHVRANQFLKSSEPKIMRYVAYWTKEKKYTISELMKDLVYRTKELNLYVRKDDLDTDSKTTAYITTLVMNHLFTGKFKRQK